MSCAEAVVVVRFATPEPTPAEKLKRAVEEAHGRDILDAAVYICASVGKEYEALSLEAYNYTVFLDTYTSPKAAAEAGAGGSPTEEDILRVVKGIKDAIDEKRKQSDRTVTVTGGTVSVTYHYHPEGPPSPRIFDECAHVDASILLKPILPNLM
jgi:hypothetical protein